jgi:carbon-monoxide dehydrogenase medium subunit
LAPDEILTRISFAPLDDSQSGTFIKLGLRRAQAISVLSVAAVLRRDAAGVVTQAAISLGAVAPVVIRTPEAEQALIGTRLDDASIAQAARLAQEAATPIDDIRATAAYRRAMVETLTSRALHQIHDGQERTGWPAAPVMLWGQTQGRVPVRVAAPDASTLVNGTPVTLAGGMTLLDSLRQSGYVGVKEGCAEGECGACTVFLDGMAVMACLVPAERAAGCEVITVEGLGDLAHLHPVQDALVQSGGVQCGYCTPGFVMSAAKLLEERPHPTRREAQEAITGNFCRCTGYRKIIDAVVQAGQDTP